MMRDWIMGGLICLAFLASGVRLLDENETSRTPAGDRTSLRPFHPASAPARVANPTSVQPRRAQAKGAEP